MPTINPRIPATAGDGGPAFPVVNGTVWPEVHSGMSLRDYFAARAPADIPDSFEPARYIPVVFPPAPVGLHEGRASDIRRYDDVAGLDLVEASYWYACQAARERQKAAALAAVLQRQARWRYAFADAMLAARAGTAVANG